MRPSLCCIQTNSFTTRPSAHGTGRAASGQGSASADRGGPHSGSCCDRTACGGLLRLHSSPTPDPFWAVRNHEQKCHQRLRFHFYNPLQCLGVIRPAGQAAAYAWLKAQEAGGRQPLAYGRTGGGRWPIWKGPGLLGRSQPCRAVRSVAPRGRTGPHSVQGRWRRFPGASQRRTHPAGRRRRPQRRRRPASIPTS